MYAYLFEADDE